MSWYFILCGLMICEVTTKGLSIVKRSPEEHVPHEGRLGDTDLDESDYPPLRGIEPALPPHLRYTEKIPREMHFARERKNTAQTLIPMYEQNIASARKLIENNTFDVTSGNITINDDIRAITKTFREDNSDINTTQTLGTLLPETLKIMKEFPTKTINITSIKTNKTSSFRQNISNLQPGRSLSDRQPISRRTTIRYINDTNSSNMGERKEELNGHMKNDEKVANRRNEDAFNPFHHQVIENKVSTQSPITFSTVTENQDDVVDGFIIRIQDHWIQFVQQMKQSVMGVWQTITSRIMNSLENFSVTIR